MPITQTIQGPSVIPNRITDSPEQFSENAVQSLTDQAAMGAQQNEYATQANALAIEVNDNAATALSASNAAVAAANYKGDWTTTSDVKQGESYSYLGKEWIAKQDSVNVTPVEGAFWIEGFGDAVNVRYDNTASGLTGTDVQGAIDEVEVRVDTAEANILTNQAYVGGQIIATGSAVFNNADNSIELEDIGVGVEVGDVITISGAANAKNNSEFTIEVITDNDNIIVNQAHAGGTTSKSLVSETASVTVKLLCKWYLAPIGLGQGCVDVTASRAFSTPYQNPTKRTIIASAEVLSGSGQTFLSLRGIVDGFIVSRNEGASNTGNQVRQAISITVPSGSIYEIICSSSSNFNFSELR